MNEENEQAGSLAVKDGIITHIWETSTAPKEIFTIDENTKIIDLEGATLLPGFIDTHNHILSYALMLDMVNCSSPLNKNIEEVLVRIREKAKELSKGEWIQGFGYDDTLLAEHRHITRQELDEAAPDHPVYLNHSSGHIAAVNSKALEIADIAETIEDTSKGHFGRDDAGRLNGVLFEHGAMGAVNQVIPEKTEDELLLLLRKAVEEYLAQGITMNSVAAVGMMHTTELELNVHFKAGKTKLNPMRTQLMLVHNLFEGDELFGTYSAAELDAEIREKSGGRVRLDSAKLFQDGSIQGLTAALREPYTSNPDLTGELIHSQDALNEAFLNLHNRGFRIAVHGNGDRAIESILEGYAYVLSKTPGVNHRHRIEHAQTANHDDLNKMKELGVIPSFFINHIYYFGDRHEKIFLGTERAKCMNPLKTATEKGLRFTLHSDNPITPISPLFSVWVAVNRVTLAGEVLGADEKCDVITALKSMTLYGAELNFDEENAGSIDIGKRADFAILEQDPTAIDPLQIKDIKVLGTIIDGEFVYEAEE